MKRIKQFLMGTVLAAAGFAAMPFTSYAQTSDRPSAMRWKGADVTKLKEEFLLYNVGTGKFMTAGGGWGVQGMLLYQDFGTMMGLVSKDYKTYGIKSNIENVDYKNAKYLGINYPGYTSAGTWGDSNTFGPIMEAQSSGTEPVTYSRKWTFERVKGISDSYVYNMKETLIRIFNSDLELYMGASYGVNPEKGPDRGCDVFVGDAATFTTTEVFNSTFASGNEKAAYYQWILVPKSEIMDVYNKSIEAGGGLNANFTYLVTDPMFDRNHTGFEAWRKNVIGSGTGTDKRYDWFFYDKKNPNGKITTDKWDAAVFRKVSIESKENGKYSFASFDGIGEVSQTFKAPADGVYEIECRGFYQGNKAKLFVTVGGVTKEASLVNTGSEFTKCTLLSDYGGTTVTEEQKLAAGKALYDNENGKYTVKVVISATVGSDIKIGIKKDAATKSDACYYTDKTYYYYDTDYVGVDNFAVRYVGKSKASIFVLDEDATSTEYMKKATGKDYEDVTVYLKRRFTLNKWNSFVTPVGLTNAQVKQAFGDDVKVAELAGVGVTGSESSIDFRTVDLSQEGIAIKPAQMYLVKPTKDAVDMNLELVDGTKVSGKMYLIGRRSFDGSKITDGTLTTKPTYGQSAEGAEQVDFMGTYVALDATNGPQKGAYAWSGGDMYYLNKANAIKGFRGWLVDHTGTNSIKFNIGDGSVTSIDEVIANDRAEKTSDAVYTVDGVKIRDNASSLEGLPAGLYIFKGKTHLVK